jgi:hypothetical protein
MKGTRERKKRSEGWWDIRNDFLLNFKSLVYTSLILVQ